MLDELKSKFHIIGPGGVPKGTVEGVYSRDVVFIDDASANIAMGDELRRAIPNGTEEAFDVLDPVFYEEFHTLPAHFQVKIRRKGAFSAGTGGNYTINISGNNPRVNLHSTDNSHNTVVDNRVFSELRSAINGSVQDQKHKELLLQSVNEMERSSNDKAGFLNAYQRFISSAANHMTVVAPFLPALATLLG